MDLAVTVFPKEMRALLATKRLPFRGALRQEGLPDRVILGISLCKAMVALEGALIARRAKPSAGRIQCQFRRGRGVSRDQFRRYETCAPKPERYPSCALHEFWPNGIELEIVGVVVGAYVKLRSKIVGSAVQIGDAGPNSVI